jgi:hypothetical protein
MMRPMTLALSWLVLLYTKICFTHGFSTTTHNQWPAGCSRQRSSSSFERRTRRLDRKFSSYRRIEGNDGFFRRRGGGKVSIVKMHASFAEGADDDGGDDNEPDILPPTNQDDVDVDEEEEDDETDEQDYLYIATKVPTADSPRWELGNDFDQFLNQCTAQSFLFLLTTCRDPHTVQYLEKFTKPMISAPPRPRYYSSPENAALSTGDTGNSKFLSYHGLAAMNTTAYPTWDSYFQTLLEQPKKEYLIESGLKYIPDYEMEINPPSLCTRMISVREQIAREFVHDLKILSHMGDDFMAAYWDGIKNGNDGDPLRTGISAELLFLDDERDYAPSPLRKGNFDLIALMATQESIHRLLNNDPKGEGGGEEESLTQQSLSKSNRQYLSHFYLQRLVSHFTNRQPYGQWTKFLLELLQSSPTVSMSADSIVDPTRIVEQILTVRQAVALEWRVRAMEVPDLHVTIKRLQLDLLMKSYDTSPDAFQ